MHYMKYHVNHKFRVGDVVYFPVPTQPCFDLGPARYQNTLHGARQLVSSDVFHRRLNP
jgi:hypothetical protein